MRQFGTNSAPKSDAAPIRYQFGTSSEPKSESEAIRHQFGTKVKRSRMPNIGPECPEIDRRRHPTPIQHQLGANI